MGGVTRPCEVPGGVPATVKRAIPAPVWGRMLAPLGPMVRRTQSGFPPEGDKDQPGGTKLRESKLSWRITCAQAVSAEHKASNPQIAVPVKKCKNDFILVWFRPK